MPSWKRHRLGYVLVIAASRHVSVRGAEVAALLGAGPGHAVT
ncbi:hypothetical protein [Streptosporangium jomthongense]|uniref:Uncharacterized protein n=1 Tax=Streptosporangium jomthongense TaxID=1193683 RepID=A0ABV8EVX0_9ACTN